MAAHGVDESLGPGMSGSCALAEAVLERSAMAFGRPRQHSEAPQTSRYRGEVTD